MLTLAGRSKQYLFFFGAKKTQEKSRGTKRERKHKDTVRRASKRTTKEHVKSSFGQDMKGSPFSSRLGGRSLPSTRTALRRREQRGTVHALRRNDATKPVRDRSAGGRSEPQTRHRDAFSLSKVLGTCVGTLVCSGSAFAQSLESELQSELQSSFPKFTVEFLG